MPDPSTIVILLDADGDEFPVRIWGKHNNEQYAFETAVRKAQAIVQEGAWHPNGELRFGSMEIR